MAPSELGLIFLAVALLAGALDLLNSAYQLIRRQDAHAGWFSALASLVTAVATVGALVIHVFFEPLSLNPLSMLLIMGIALLSFGLLIVLIERRRESYDPQYSFGLLLVGIGLLVSLLTLFMPLLPGQLSPPPLPTATITATPTVAPSAIPTSRFSPTPTKSPTATFTASMTPSPSTTPTRERYSTRTPTSTATVVAFCSALVNYNLNLRADVTTESEALDLIPYNSIIEVAGSNTDGDWWFVAYNGQWGWVLSQYIVLSGCQDAPVVPN